jgi:hypothetical protein
MPNLMRFRANAFAWLLAAGAGSFAQQPAVAQQQFVPGVREPVHAFLSDAENEAKRGTYLFYTQDYRDKRKRNVNLHGSLYGVLRDVHINGCDVEARVEIVDLFSGTIRDIPTGDVQDKTEYAIRFRLTHEIAAGLDVIDGRPSQLSRAMHTRCAEEAACTFTWLRIRSAQPALYEQIVLNNSVTFDGAVTHVLAPVSSREAGTGLVRDLQELAAGACR